MACLVYLHGFASGPRGHKGEHCRLWAERNEVPYHAPDLDVPDFEHVTIRAQVLLLEQLLDRLSEPPVVVGASLGGLVATAVGMRGRSMKGLVLLAPAFGFARRRLCGPRWAGYRRRGTLRVFHHGQNAWTQLGPSLLQDLESWRDDASWTLGLPIRIIHGIFDVSVPIEESRCFAARQKDCRLLEIEDDHSLLAPVALDALDRALEELLEIRPDRDWRT